MIFLFALAPSAYLWIFWALDRHPFPLTFIVKESGDWSMRFLVVVVAITPLRRILGFSRLVTIRRMLGLASLFYGLLHLVAYVAQQEYDWIAIFDGMVGALYLTTGYVALVLMMVLGVTSNDFSIRSMGTIAWRRVHLVVFPCVILSLLHFLLEVRVDADEVAILGGSLLFVLGYRMLVRFKVDARPGKLTVLSIVCAIATALFEASYFKWGTGVHAESLLWGNFEFSNEIRPAWWVLVVGLWVAAIVALRGRRAHKRGWGRYRT